MEIRLTLKNPKLKSYHVTGWIVVVFYFLAQFAFTFTTRYENERIYTYTFLGLMALLLAARWGGKFNFIDRRMQVGILMAFVCVIWIKWGLYMFAGLGAVSYYSYFISMRKLEVIVLEKSISYPSYPSRQIGWNELQNMIVKDGMLTIDFKNNKILQTEIESNQALNEKEFNEFCRKHLAK
jgi:hypothetical protein